MMAPKELNRVECMRLLDTGGVGRIAFATADGPMIYPVNFMVDGQSVVFRTAAHGTLGQHIGGTDVAFEVDQLNWSSRRGWSVVVKGRAELVEDPAEVNRLRELGREPQPWAQGLRRLYVRIPWAELSGREVGEEWLGSAQPASVR